MRRISVLTLACLIGGFLVLAYGVLIGEARVYFVLVLPVIVGSGITAFAGAILLMMGFALGFLGLARFSLPEMTPETPAESPPASQPAAPAKRFGGVVFLGPIPIVFGSDPKMSKYMLVLASVVTVLLIAFVLLILFARP